VALVLCHTLGWSWNEAGAALDTSAQAINSALQRARATLQERLPGPRQDWAPARTPTQEERALLTRFMAAWERADADALVAMMRDDVRWAMPPAPLWFDGRGAIAKLFDAFPIGWNGDPRVLATAANRQPAMASYIRPHGGSTHALAALTVIRMEEGRIVELTNFAAPLRLPRRSTERSGRSGGRDDDLGQQPAEGPALADGQPPQNVLVHGDRLRD
jgi:RNA polymerase sigma-70 factor, ECF subfamily